MRGAQPKATLLLLARRCRYGDLEIHVGTPADREASPVPSEADLRFAERAAGRLANVTGSADAFESIRYWIAYYTAARRSIDARRAETRSAALLARCTLDEIAAQGGSSLSRRSC